MNGVKRGLIYSVSFLLVTGLAPASVGNTADPNLVGCWRFNGNTLDSSGNEFHGTLHGDPQFVTGVYDKALEFDGDDYVTIDGYRGVLGTHARSITAWIKTASSETQEILFWGTDTAPQKIEFRVHSNTLRLGHGSGNAQGNTVVTDGEWHHVAVTLPENAVIDDVRFYLDGQDDTSSRSDPDAYNTVADWEVAIGCRSSRPDRYFIGSIDDVLIYDKVLTQQEVKLLMRGDPHLAWDPNPPNEATVGVDRAKQLTWSPGYEAYMHDVYFGTDPEAVTNADVAVPLGVYQGRQNPSRYPAVGNLGLEFGQTYFWRVDEVSDAQPDSPWKGEVWSFEVEAYLLVDDFDSYADTNDLLHTWVDGNDNGSGSTISLETEFIGNSMKCVYDNTSYPWYSEGGHAYSVPQDWTVSGAKALELQFRGDVNNVAEPMYVALEDAAGNSTVVAHADPNALIQGRWEGWQIWAIALQDFVDANGVNLANIKKITVGIGDGVDSFPLTSTGTVYFDDIRLYPPRCLPEYVATSFNNDCITDLTDLDIVARHWLISDYNVVAVEPDNDRLRAHYKFDETSGSVANDSSGRGYHATVDASATDAWDPCGYDGGCLELDGTFGVSVPNGVFGNVRDEVTISVWVHIDVNVNPNAVGRAEFSAGLADSNQPWDRLAWVQEEPENYVGRWSHYAFAKDAGHGMMRIYHNGLLVAQNTGALQPMDSADMGPSTIGSRADGDGGYYKGVLDEFRIYDYALSHAEVLYLAKGAGSESYQPLQPVLSPVDPYEDGRISFRDFAVMAEWWLEELLWP